MFVFEDVAEPQRLAQRDALDGGGVEAAEADVDEAPRDDVPLVGGVVDALMAMGSSGGVAVAQARARGTARRRARVFLVGQG